MIRRFTTINGRPGEVLETLKKDKYIQQNKQNAKEAIEEFEVLFGFLRDYNAEYLDYIRIDMSMVRGLDYYTGIIMEAQFADKNVCCLKNECALRVRGCLDE